MLRRIFLDLDMLESWRRERLTPEERAAEDRRERILMVRDAILVLAALAVMLSLTVLPWVIGLWSIKNYLIG